MSTWIESGAETSFAAASTADVVFKLDCRRLPVDHAAELANGICALAPWLVDLPMAAIHSVHVAGSQNGWSRPDAQSGEWLELSRRTRLRIRVPIDRASQLVGDLENKQLNLAGENMRLITANVKQLVAGTTLFARYTFFDESNHSEEGEDEDEFLSRVISVCEASGFTPSKLMCGRTQMIQSADGPLLTRSVLLDDVPIQHSLRLQDVGIGDKRLLGCGIVIPHKDTAAVN